MFLPVVFILALIIRKTSVQNVLLLFASLLFYAYGEPIYVLLMIGTCLFVYVFGMLVGRSAGAARKAFCAFSVIACLLSLGLFKYADWIVHSIADVTQGAVALPEPSLTLPIGISFYTFQAISYIIDVYRGDVPAQKNVIRVLLYISFFPQLIAGPIIRYHDVDEQLTTRHITVKGVQLGLKRFIMGLTKKILVADIMAKCVDAIFAADPGAINAPLAWLGALAYLIQIYFDFSAYSDMAIGMAKMFGFTYKENFNYPYISTSIKEFWRRWHISLSTWLKEYLYIPLGGNRKGRGRTVANKIFVFFCCGLWHGAAWTFVIWGLIHGFFLLIEEYLPVKKLPKPLGWLYAMLVVTFAFVLFRADTIDQGFLMMSQMVCGWSQFTTSGWLLWCGQLTPLFICALVAGAIFAFPILPTVRDRVSALPPHGQKTISLISDIGCLLLLGVCVLTIAGGAYSPFIYFRF